MSLRCKRIISSLTPLTPLTPLSKKNRYTIHIPKSKMTSVSQVYRTPVLTDVSLRDGLQCLPKNMLGLFTTDKKEQVFRNQIILNKHVENVEIGSIVSPNFYPVFSDSLKLYKRLDSYKHNSNQDARLFLLVPNFYGFQKGICYGVNNFSFITSVSESFQKNNTNRTIIEMKKEIQSCFKVLNDNNILNYRTKIYISCISECPLEGKINMDTIINEIIDYSIDYENTEICLSDTCGTLTIKDFQYIITQCLMMNQNINLENISLHLHVDYNNMNEVSEIIQFCKRMNIHKFDVSLLDYGGCSKTISEEKTKPNMTYDLFYKLWE